MEKAYRKIALVLAVIMVFTMFSGCSSSTSTVPAANGGTSASAPGSDSTTLIVAQSVDAASLDPIQSTSIPNMNFSNNIYNGLTERNSNLEIVPSLATEWKALDDTTWEFILRKGVTFHNGEAFNADAVVYSWKRIFAEGSKSPQQSWFDTISDIEVIDDSTIHIKTSSPDPVLPARMTMLFIVPPKYVQQVGDEKFGLEPVGTGPYKVVEWVKNDHVAFEANKDYWNGEPEFKKVVFRVIPEAQSRVYALLAGEADVISGVTPDQVASIESNKGTSVGKIPSTRVMWAQFVCDKDGSPFKDKRVRQAINYAVNVDEIIKYVMQGNAQRTATVLSPYIFGYDESVKPYEYNPEKAKQLLTEAGYDASHVLEVTFDSPNGRYVLDKEVTQAIASQLSEVGIKVNLNLLEWGTYSSMFNTHKTNNMWYLGWSLPAMDPDSWLYPLLHTGESLANWGNPEYDAIVEAARREMDTNKRAALYSQAQTMLKDEAPMLFLFQLIDLYGISDRVSWTPRADESLRFSEMKIK